MVNRNGAFPTYSIKSSKLRFDGEAPLYLTDPPSVSSAIATDYNKVRVYYSTEVRHTSPSNPDDSLNPANYDFTGSEPVDASSVSLVQAIPTIVEVTLNAEMTQGASYSVTVSNVLSIGGDSLAVATANFTGYGISPRVASAEVRTPRCTRIHFDEAMDDDGDLTTTTNYVITGPTSPTVSLINVGQILGVTYSDVFFTGSVTHGGAYHIEVSNVHDLAHNLINPSYDTGDFTGFNPELTGAVASTPAGFAIELTFNTEMKHVNPLDPLDVMNYGNYTVVGPLGSQPVINVTLSQASPTIIKIHLGTEMHDGGDYTVTVANVQTIGGHPLYVNEADFTGVGVAPYVVSASTLEPRKVQVTFDDLMKKDAAFLDPDNYVITGPTSPTATLIEAEGPAPSTCDVTFTGAVTHGGLYTVEVSNVLDIAENPIDTDHDTGNFTGMNPEVSLAEAQDDHTVRVTYNVEMKHASAGNPDDALNPANYELTCPILEASVTSVDLVSANPTVVDLNLDAEMTQDGAYTVAVSNVETTGGFPLYVTEAEFTGIGTQPQLESADCTAYNTVVVWFDELMTHNANLTDETNYTIDGPTVLTVTDVVAADVGDQTKCTLTVSGFMHDDNYQVNVVEVIDLAGNVIDPAHDTQEFLGICPGPKVSLSKDNIHSAVFIQFDQPVLNALDHTHYTFDPDPEVVEIEVDPEVENGYIVVMNVDEEGVDYTMFISADVTSLAGFPMNPDHDTVDFTGKANEPPVALLTEAGREGWSLTEPIHVRAYDPQYLLGIDETTWSITLTRPLLEGGVETLTPVIAGELQAGFSGSKSGDPLRPVGVTWTLLPDLLWASGGTYTVESYIEDTEGMPNVDTTLGTFATVIVDAEDVEWEETALDKRIWTPLTDPDLKNCEILRSYLLPICTHSTKRTIRSRTLLYWSSRCPNRAAAPLVDDYRIIADLKFRLRPTNDEFLALANDFLPAALKAVDELNGIDDETKIDLKALLTDPRPINIVSTMASIVVLAVFETQD